MLPGEQRAQDLDILVWAAKNNWYVVTKDKGYLETNTHPCDTTRYARRTVLWLQTYQLGRAHEYLRAAWNITTWEGLRKYDAIRVQQDKVIAYRCAGREYAEVGSWDLRIKYQD